MFTFCILRRFPQEINIPALMVGCRELKAGRTRTYKRLARIEAAPRETDCLTAMRYLVKKVMGIKLELDRIGNMPRYLVTKWNWSVVKISSPEQLRPCDLIFFGSPTSLRLITHVGMVAHDNLVFHSSKEKCGGARECLSELFLRYNPLTDDEQMLSYIDPRRPVALPRELRLMPPEVAPPPYDSVVSENIAPAPLAQEPPPPNYESLEEDTQSEISDPPSSPLRDTDCAMDSG